MNQSGVGIPKVSIDVSFVNLADTEEYKDLIPLQQVNLCDVIPVQFESLGIDTTAKIVKTEYDVLGERYNKITVGSLRSNLATAITEQNANMVAETSARFSQVTTEIDNATAWLTNADGYVIAVKNIDGTWKELIFADHQDPSDWVHCLRINENGIGFSSDGGTTYTQAWTLDGRLVIGGTDVPSITVYDSDDNVIFQADADAMIWNATNSSMDANGYITMTGANINNGAIEMVGVNQWLKLQDGVIYGGYGTTVGQNQTYISFETLVNGQSGNICLDARNLFLSIDGISVTDNRGDNNGTLGRNGDYVIDVTLTDDTFNYVEEIHDNGDGTIGWTTVSNAPIVTGWSVTTHDMVHGIGT